MPASLPDKTDDINEECVVMIYNKVGLQACLYHCDTLFVIRSRQVDGIRVNKDDAL